MHAGYFGQCTDARVHQKGIELSMASEHHGLRQLQYLCAV